jgi:hypothetical protein
LGLRFQKCSQAVGIEQLGVDNFKLNSSRFAAITDHWHRNKTFMSEITAIFQRAQKEKQMQRCILKSM